MSRSIHVDWLPITFSTSDAEMLYVEGDERREGHVLRRNIVQPGEMTMLGGLFLLDEKYKTNTRRQVEVSLKSIKNGGLINQAIIASLLRHFNNVNTQCKKSFNAVSVIMPETERNPVPEFSIFDSYELI